MDAVGESVETEVNDALPSQFRFHRVGKVVLCLGPTPKPEPDYTEQLGVALKQMPAFDMQDYSTSSEDRRVAQLRSVVLEAFAWFEAHFTDAQFIGMAKAKLPWAQPFT